METLVPLFLTEVELLKEQQLSERELQQQLITARYLGYVAVEES